MVCSREVSEPCREVRVELHGAAKEEHPYCAGSYLPVKGKINRGKWVLQHADGSEKFLRVPTGSVNWMIGSTIDGGGWIKSASAGVGCPASAANKKNDRSQEKS